MYSQSQVPGKMKSVIDRQRAALLMEEQGLDVLLATGADNLSYLSGYLEQNLYSEFMVDGEPNRVVAALPRDPDRDAIFITHVTAKSKSWMEDHRYYGRSRNLDSPAPGIFHFLTDMEKDTTIFSCFATALAEHGIPDPTIGVDLDHTPVNVFQDLRESLPEATFIDASNLFWNLRMVKSEDEIKHIREAARVGELAMQAAFDVAGEGMRWGIVSDVMEKTIAEEGAEQTFVHLGFGPNARIDGSEWEYAYIQSGCHVPNQLSVARDKRFLRGDVGRIDLGCSVVRPYQCDFARVAVVGEATDEMTQVYGAMVESYRRMVGATRPGIEAAQLFRTGYEPLADAGLQPTVVLLGHGIGVDVHERPFLVPTDHTLLEAGMVLTIEVVVYTDQLWSMNLEDMVLVTEEGCEILTTLGHVDGLPQMVVIP